MLTGEKRASGRASPRGARPRDFDDLAGEAPVGRLEAVRRGQAPEGLCDERSRRADVPGELRAVLAKALAQGVRRELLRRAGRRGGRGFRTDGSVGPGGAVMPLTQLHAGALLERVPGGFDGLERLGDAPGEGDRLFGEPVDVAVPGRRLQGVRSVRFSFFERFASGRLRHGARLHRGEL